MKRILVSLMAFCLVVPAAFCQQREFTAAMKAKPMEDGYYKLDLSKKAYDLEMISEFAKNNGYVCRRVTQDMVAVFGEPRRVVTYLEFIPKSQTDAGSVQISTATRRETSVINAEHSSRADELAKILKKAVKNGYYASGKYCGMYVAKLPDTGLERYTDSFVQYVAENNGYYVNRAYSFECAIVPKEYRVNSAIVMISEGKYNDKTANRVSGYACLGGAFEWVDDIVWTGTLSNGVPSGYGKGIVFRGEEVYVFECDFSNGRPSQTVKFSCHAFAEIFKWDGQRSSYGEVKLYTESDGIIKSLVTKSGHDGIEDILGRPGGTYYSFLNHDYTERFKLGDHPYVESFKDGYVRFQTEYQSIVTYVIDKDGKISYSPESLKRIMNLFHLLTDDWDYTLNTFSQCGSLNVELARVNAIDEFVQKSKLLDPNELFAAEPDNYRRYLIIRDVAALYDYSYTGYEKTRYVNKARDKVNDRINVQKGRKFSVLEIIPKPIDWMSKRLSASNKIVERLANDPEFNPLNKQKALDYYLGEVHRRKSEYEDLVLAVEDVLSGGQRYLSSSIKDIFDQSRCTVPYGRIVNEGFVVDDWQSENKGEIYFKNVRDHIQYVATYASAKEEKCNGYKVTYCSDPDLQVFGTFLTIEDLYQAIANAYNKKYR